MAYGMVYKKLRITKKLPGMLSTAKTEEMFTFFVDIKASDPACIPWSMYRHGCSLSTRRHLESDEWRRIHFAIFDTLRFFTMGGGVSSLRRGIAIIQIKD